MVKRGRSTRYPLRCGKTGFVKGVIGRQQQIRFGQILNMNKSICFCDLFFNRIGSVCAVWTVQRIGACGQPSFARRFARLICIGVAKGAHRQAVISRCRAKHARQLLLGDIWIPIRAFTARP